MDEEQVFKALADASRRILLDALFATDGQTLAELQIRLPMTRFGVMKHLAILEEAGLVSTRKVGREKFHYLNPVPIQMVYDRWVDKYARRWTRPLTDLKAALEESTMSEKPNHVLEVFIRTTPEKLWQALTEGQFTSQYYFGTAVESTWQPGAPYHYRYPTGESMLEGEIVESNPPHKLVMTFRPTFTGGEEALRTSTVTFEIQQLGPSCSLTLTHYGLNPDAGITQGIGSGWAQILSGLKTLLETGQPLLVEFPETSSAS